MASTPEDSAAAQQARAAVQRLDQCLIQEARRLQSARMEPVEKHLAFMTSCAPEREAAVALALRREWQALQPQSREERLRAARITTLRIANRFQIWAERLLEPPPVSY